MQILFLIQVLRTVLDAFGEWIIVNHGIRNFCPEPGLSPFKGFIFIYSFILNFFGFTFRIFS